MYKISGADGKEYGPVSVEQMRQWIAEGRVNSQTRVQEAGAGEWKTAAEFPELGFAPVGGTAGGRALSPPPIPTPGSVHQLTSFPVAAVILLHYITCGIFSLIWLNLMHGKLPRVRSDDPSAGRAIGFCFIPFYNLYWIFFTYRRLCLRIDEQRNLYGLPPSNLSGWNARVGHCAGGLCLSNGSSHPRRPAVAGPGASQVSGSRDKLHQQHEADRPLVSNLGD
jgi:hypothetical protein